LEFPSPPENAPAKNIGFCTLTDKVAKPKLHNAPIPGITMVLFELGGDRRKWGVN